MSGDVEGLHPFSLLCRWHRIAGREAKNSEKRLAYHLSEKWHKQLPPDGVLCSDSNGHCRGTRKQPSDPRQQRPATSPPSCYLWPARHERLAYLVGAIGALQAPIGAQCSCRICWQSCEPCPLRMAPTPSLRWSCHMVPIVSLPVGFVDDACIISQADWKFG
jgi:hypothetical protein